MTDPVVDPDFPPEDPVPPEQEPVEPGPEMPVVGGWLDAAAQAEADAKQYTDEQVPLVAGRLVPRNMDRPPTVEDGTDLIAGTGWNQYDPATGDLVQMWRWDGTAWQALDMSAQMIPVLDIGSATVGDLTGDRINVTGTLSANIVDAMDLETKKLVVSEEAILNHATLIGQTVVDDINVQGKLIGTDGVFTGTVDFENVNVTGLQLVEKLEANSISADLIEGGRFTGETFEGGSFVGGEFRTSDNLPGQVRLADDAYVTHLDGGGVFPGLRITPADASDFSHLPGVGPGEHGVTIYGGRRTGGGSSIVQANPTESFMRTFHEGGGEAGEIQTSPAESYMRTYREDGTAAGVIQTSATESLMRTYREDGEIGGSIQASPTKAFMQTYGDPAVGRSYSQVDPQQATMNVVNSAGNNIARITADGNTVTLFSATNGQRYLKLNSTGIWIETGGKSYNLEETAQDSGWQAITLASGITGAGSPAWRNKGGVIYMRGTVTYAWTGGGTWDTIATGLPEAARPQVRVHALSPDTSVNTLIFRVTQDGQIQGRRTNEGGGQTIVGELSGIQYTTG